MCYSLVIQFWFMVDTSLNLEHLYFFLEMSRVEQHCHTSIIGAVSQVENGVSLMPKCACHSRGKISTDNQS